MWCEGDEVVCLYAPTEAAPQAVFASWGDVTALLSSLPAGEDSSRLVQRGVMLLADFLYAAGGGRASAADLAAEDGAASPSLSPPLTLTGFGAADVVRQWGDAARLLETIRASRWPDYVRASSQVRI